MFAGSCKIAFNVRCARRSRSPQGENIRADGSDKSAWSGKYDIKGECFTRNPHQIDNGRTNQNNTYRDPLKSTKWTNFISRVHSANAYSFELERNNSNNHHSPRKRQTLIYRCASYMYIYKMRLCFLRNKWERIENNRKTQQLHLNIRRKKKKNAKRGKNKDKWTIAMKSNTLDVKNWSLVFCSINQLWDSFSFRINHPRIVGV